MSWKYVDNTTNLNLNVGVKVKTQLTPFKCALGDTIESDEIVYKKTWIVDNITSSNIILKSGNNIMKTTLNGFAIDEYIHHKIYKIKE